MRVAQRKILPPIWGLCNYPAPAGFFTDSAMTPTQALHRLLIAAIVAVVGIGLLILTLTGA